MAGVGVDMVEIARMRRILTRTPRFRYRVFTEEERAYCDKRADPGASYAGCFAAREAVLKALGCGFDSVGFADVSVSHDEKGRPVAILAGEAAKIAQRQGVTEVYISISHTREVAVANAVASTPDSVPRREERKEDEKAVIEAQFKQARALLDDLDRGKDR